MIDVRYLGLTMIGIFLALAAGLMIGSALGSPDRLAAAIDGLQHQFELLREQHEQVRGENEELERRLRSREVAEQALLPLAVRGRLAGTTVGVVICGGWDPGSFWSELEYAVSAAGGRVGPVLRVPDRTRPLDAPARVRFGGAWPAGSLPPEPAPFETAGWALRYLSTGADPGRLAELAGATGMELRGDYRQPVRRFLVLVAAPDELRARLVAANEVPEARLVEAARNDPSLRLVIAEPEESRFSALEPLRRRDVPTVDNIDTGSGQIAAILALAGADGHFGSRPNAARPLPPLSGDG